MLSLKEIILEEGDDEFFVISDPKGYPRWAIPVEFDYPRFISLYNSQTIKARIYKLLVRLCYNFGLKSYLFLNKINGTLKDEFKKILLKTGSSEFSIFYGTPGLDRKIIIEMGNKKDIVAFCKVATTRSSLSLIANENKTLINLSSHDYKLLRVPKVIDTSKISITISNIKPSIYYECKNLTKLHILAVDELYGKNEMSLKPLLTISSVVTFLRLSNDSVILDEKNRGVFSKLRNELDISLELLGRVDVLCGLSHGDFTPWNMFMSEECLNVYDWEMSSEKAPLLYDIFHFFLQTEIMVHNSSIETIQENLGVLFRSEHITFFESKYNIDASLYFYAYLVSISSYYLIKYSQQDKLHTQAVSLLTKWGELMECSRKFYEKNH